jgi:drug/metabolite transporter (DMT)-like permease
MSTNNLKGIGYLLLALLIMSLQGVAVKFIGGSYSIMEIVLFRSFVALPCTLFLFRLEGKRGLPITTRPALEIARGVFFFLSYTTAFMGLAALPLAEFEAIRFSGPLMITILSVWMLQEKVEPSRWLALIVGFFGVILIVKPGSASFNLGSVFVLISVFFYAVNAMLTRKLRTTDRSATMSYFSSLVYLVAAIILSPLTLLAGDVSNAYPSIAFLLRAWTMPTFLDWVVMSGLGLVWAFGMYFIARAYSAAQASAVAPFEYASLPINIMWGFLFWHELPSALTIAGAFLTLLSGLFILYQEQKGKPEKPQEIASSHQPEILEEFK